MSQTRNITEFLNRLYDIALLTPGQIDKQRITSMIWKHYAGSASREIRREVCSKLAGKQLYIAHSGVNVMVELAIQHLQTSKDMGSITINPKVATASEEWAGKIAKAEQSADYAGWVGKVVIRKACKRTGEVAAVECGKSGKYIVTVKLADGSLRYPNAQRFQKLYNFA